MTTHVEEVATTVGLVIGGDVEAGGDGTYPVTNPARPAEVVLEAPATSADQLDRAVGAARRSQVAWAALPAEERAALVLAAAEAGVAAVESGDLARLLTREHGKTYLESVFDTATVAGMAAAFAPVVAAALAPRHVSGGSTRIEWVPHGVVAAILPFNWPVSVMANKALPALLAGNAVVVKAPPTCPATVLLVAAAMAEVLPPGILSVVNGPDAALGAALVGHRDVDMVSFTGGVGTGQAVMAAAARTTRPVVLELGGNDAAIVAPDVTVGAALAGRLVDAAFVTSGQVCMAVKRLYVHRDQLERTVDALAERLASEVVGDGLAEGVTMGPVHTAAAKERVDALVAEAEDDGAAVHPSRPAARRRMRRPAGTSSRRPWSSPRIPKLASCARNSSPRRSRSSPTTTWTTRWRRRTTPRSGCAPRSGATTTRWRPTWPGAWWPAPSSSNAHGLSAVDMYAPMGGWKQSGFGVELGTEGMQAFARQRVLVHRPGPAEGEGT